MKLSASSLPAGLILTVQLWSTLCMSYSVIDF